MFSPAETAACLLLIELALEEDLGAPPSDVTTELFVPPGHVGSAAFVARKPGVVAGLPAAALVCGAVDPLLRFEPVLDDGQDVKPGDTLAHVRGPMWAILRAERTALNFLQHLSGIASSTQRYVRAVVGTSAQILDTRKTLPGWRLLAKYAVRQGGGRNHRIGLYDGVLIKDNHLAFAHQILGDSIAKTLQHVRAENERLGRNLPIEVEVDTLDQLDDALAGGPDIVLLDNMDVATMREAVRRRAIAAPRTQLEASGGVTLDTVRAIAETGVDRISIGGLTHSVAALDIGLDYEA